jgi:hypothetical protein
MVNARPPTSDIPADGEQPKVGDAEEPKVDNAAKPKVGNAEKPKVRVADKPKVTLSDPRENDQWDNRQFDDVMKIYNILNQIQRYEGAGIWSRFNIIVSLHAVLFGAVAFTYSSQPPSGRTLVMIFSVGGCLLSLWALYVLHRLWMWHTHWKDKLHDIESRFPLGLPRLFADRPRPLIKNRRWYQSWLLSYTQPFLVILFLVWFSIGLFTSTTGGLVRSQTQTKFDAANAMQSPTVSPTPQLSAPKNVESKTPEAAKTKK